MTQAVQVKSSLVQGEFLPFEWAGDSITVESGIDGSALAIGMFRPLDRGISLEEPASTGGGDNDPG